MNAVFLALVVVSFLVAGTRGLWSENTDGGMTAVSEAIIRDAGGAVTLALGLAGVMALFLGVMKVAEAGGLLVVLARLLRPLLRRLFPDVPARHPAMGAMIMNVAANVLGLGNAATPFGIRAMQHLDTLNPSKGTASDAMVLFLAINTASVTLLPTSVIALRAAAGSSDPAGILPTTLFATLCSTAVAIALARGLGRWWPIPPADDPPCAATPTPTDAPPPEARGGAVADPVDIDREYPAWVSVVVSIGILALVPATIAWGREVGPWIVPALITGLLVFGAARGVRIYETFVEGAADGFRIAVRIIPYLVAILVAVGMLRASGALDLIVRPLALLTEPMGVPVEAVLMALLRTLSGSGAYAYLASLMNDPAIGPDSYTGYLVGTIQASTETTFYVLAVYFGAVGVRRTRHALVAGLGADLAGLVASVVVCSILYR